MSDNIIREITTDELRKMDKQEGLVLQGCGGDLQEWLDGINSMLTEDGILLNGSHFESASVFQHDDLTNHVAAPDPWPVRRHVALRLCPQPAGRLH